MPSYKQPRSLRDLSVRCVSDLVQTACLNIMEFHPKSKDECFVEADKLQQYLVTRIRPLLDEVCEDTFANGDSLALRNASGLLLATFMHSHMKVLNYRYDPTKSKSSFVWGISLWEKFLENVPNLVELDLSGVGYEINGILQILGNSSIKLEIITLIGYQVSEHGLLNLSTIKTLKEIRNFHVDSLYLTRGGHDLPSIRTLLQLLPLLEDIHCRCIGEALVDLMHLTPLALQCCCEMRPTTPKIEAIARLCPNLVRLELGDPFINQQLLDFTCLTESILTVSSLKLVDFSFTSDLNCFLVQKGKYLTTLELVNFTDINLDKIKLIGKSCKGIDIFRIYLDPNYKRLYRTFINPPRKRYQNYRLHEDMFKNLLQFELEYYADDHHDETEMLMCLAHAKELQSLTFRRQSRGHFEDSDMLERIFRNLLKCNPMVELKTLVLLGPFELSIETIRYFYNLPKLTKLKLYIVPTQTVDEYLKTIEHEFVYNNIDLDLSIWLS